MKSISFSLGLDGSINYSEKMVFITWCWQWTCPRREMVVRVFRCWEPCHPTCLGMLASREQQRSRLTMTSSKSTNNRLQETSGRSLNQGNVKPQQHRNRWMANRWDGAMTPGVFVLSPTTVVVYLQRDHLPAQAIQNRVVSKTTCNENIIGTFVSRKEDDLCHTRCWCGNCRWRN